MRAMVVEVGPEIEQLVLQIGSRPEQRLIQILASNGAVLLRFPLCGVRSDNAAVGIVCKGSNATKLIEVRDRVRRFIQSRLRKSTIFDKHF
jgi:Holliday junction resolvase